jgi:ABC-type Fe3+-hydroxamate transport system substrate-binding protein
MGKDTIIDSLLSQMGLKNAVTQKGWPKISVESLLQLNPDFIIAAGNPNDLSKTTKVLKSKTGWKHFKAVKHGKIILIEPSLLSSTSHHIVKTYSQLKTKLTNKTKKN